MAKNFGQLPNTLTLTNSDVFPVFASGITSNVTVLSLKSVFGAVATVNGQAGTVVLSTLQVAENTNLYFTNARAIASHLTGFDASSGGTISSSDSVLSAFGKLEYKYNALTTEIGSRTTVIDSRLTGFNSTTGGILTAADSVLSAFEVVEYRLNAIETQLTAIAASISDLTDRVVALELA